MRNFMVMAGAAALLTACTVAQQERRSCTELAEARAAAQVERETVLLEKLERGGPGKSEVLRQFIVLDGEKYRAALRAECLRGRGPAA